MMYSMWPCTSKPIGNGNFEMLLMARTTHAIIIAHRTAAGEGCQLLNSGSRQRELPAMLHRAAITKTGSKTGKDETSARSEGGNCCAIAGCWRSDANRTLCHWFSRRN